jgi:hypothetical protein
VFNFFFISKVLILFFFLFYRNKSSMPTESITWSFGLLENEKWKRFNRTMLATKIIAITMKVSTRPTIWPIAVVVVVVVGGEGGEGGAGGAIGAAATGARPTVVVVLATEIGATGMLAFKLAATETCGRGLLPGAKRAAGGMTLEGLGAGAATVGVDIFLFTAILFVELLAFVIFF